MKPEERLERYFCRRVVKAGGEVRKVAWLGRRHAPDRLVLWPELSKHDLVELKKDANTKPRAGQLREHVRLRRAGFHVFVVDTEEDVDDYLAWRQ